MLPVHPALAVLRVKTDAALLLPMVKWLAQKDSDISAKMTICFTSSWI
jgi:hypothetical protein